LRKLSILKKYFLIIGMILLSTNTTIINVMSVEKNIAIVTRTIFNKLLPSETKGITVEHVKNGEELEKEDFIRILLTKVDNRNTVTNEWILGQLKPFEKLLFKTRIRKNEAFNQAQIAMEPIFTFKSSSAGAEDYNQLTKEFLNLCHQ